MGIKYRCTKCGFNDGGYTRLSCSDPDIIKKAVEELSIVDGNVSCIFTRIRDELRNIVGPGPKIIMVKSIVDCGNPENVICSRDAELGNENVVFLALDE